MPHPGVILDHLKYGFHAEEEKRRKKNRKKIMRI